MSTEAGTTTDGGIAGRHARDLYLRLSTMNPEHIDDIAWTIAREMKAAVNEAVEAERSASKWQPIETAPKDGTFVWVSNGFSMRVAFWAKGKEFEHRGSVGGGWRDLALAEHGGAADMMFAPAYWQALPKSPHRLEDTEPASPPSLGIEVSLASGGLGKGEA